MKRPMVLILLFASMFFISQNVFETKANACSSVSGNVSFSNYKQILSQFNSSFVQDGKYCIVFSDVNPAEIRTDNNVVEIDVSAILGDHEYDVYIIGLKVKGGEGVSAPLVNIINLTTRKLVMQEMKIFNASNGVLIQSGRGEVELTGGDGGNLAKVECRDKSGVGIDVAADGAKIKKTEITNCADGIRIEASDITIGAANLREPDFMNNIHDNAVGIHWVSGNRNRFAYNMNYNNYPSGQNRGHVYDNFVVIDSTEVERPKIIPSNASWTQVLHCDNDDLGNILSVWVQTENVPDRANVIFYSDGKYKAKCKVEKKPDDVDKCRLSLEVMPETCRLEIFDGYLAAIADTEIYSTMFVPKFQKIGDEVATIGSAVPIEIVSTPGERSSDATGGSAIEIESGDGENYSGGVDLTGEVDSRGGTSGSQMGSGTTGSGLMPQPNPIGVSGSISGGCGGGSTIVPRYFENNIGVMSLVWWVIFSAPVVILAERRINSRKKR